MKVLIAEDDPVSRLLVERMVGQWGYEPIRAEDGNEAFAILEEEDPPKLAILDWMMPGRDGVQICRHIRKRAGYPYIYLILLTAKTQRQDVIEGLSAGADDYLTKPFDAEELRARLRAAERILDLQEHLLSTSEAARFPDTHDLLTGLWNRTAIVAMLRQLARNGPGGSSTGAILVAVDHLRHINDAHGQQAGDTVLRQVTQRLRPAVRSCDSIGRYSGGSFLIVAPGCDPSRLTHDAEQLRARIAAKSVDIIAETIPVTVSIGVAVAQLRKPEDADAVLRAAGTALGLAKARGRNCVEVSTALGAPGTMVASS